MLLKVIFLSAFLIKASKASNNGNCRIENIGENDWIFMLSQKVYDNENNKIIFQSPFTDPLDVSCTCQNCNQEHEYISIYTEGKEFIIATSSYMTYMDKETPKTQSPVSYTYVCTMKCQTNTNSSLTILINVDDYNNHKPIFTQSSYNFKMASPIMPKTDLALYGNAIEVQDLDFSNMDMIFTIDHDGFDILTTVNSMDNKSYIANIRANQLINLFETTTYTITATDAGTYPVRLTQIVSISLEVDESTSLDIPSFIYANNSMAAYYYQYELNDTLTTLAGEIKLNTRKPESVTNIYLLGDWSDSFSCTFDRTTSTFTLSIQTNIENPTSVSIVFILKLKTDYEVSTPIIVYFLNSSTDLVNFNQHNYIGAYDVKNNEVKLDTDIQVISPKTPTVTITGADSIYFSVVQAGASGIYKILVTKTLPANLLKNEINVVLTLEARLSTSITYATLIINLPHASGSTSNTVYIVAISVLSILIGLFLIGSIVLYYLKFRHLNIDKWTEEEYINRFRFHKNSMNRSTIDKTRISSAIEERRPTGFSFNSSESPIEDEFNDADKPNLLDTNETGIPKLGRKKSVAFDENIEKFQIVPVNDNDDHAEVSVEDDDANIEKKDV